MTRCFVTPSGLVDPLRGSDFDAEAHEVRPCVGVVSVSQGLCMRKTQFASTTYRHISSRPFQRDCDSDARVFVSLKFFLGTELEAYFLSPQLGQERVEFL